MQLIGPINSGAAVGADGSATATGESTMTVVGLVYAVVVKYNDSPPAATCDVTVKTKGTSPNAPTKNILAIANSATDAEYKPRSDYHSTAGVAAGANDALLAVHDKIQVVIAQANAGDNADVWLYVL